MIMKQDLLKKIAQSGYVVAFAANLNFATYDIVTKVPKWIAFLSIVASIIGLGWTEFTAKSVSILFLVFSIASIYIECFADNIDSYKIRGKKNTDQLNQLKNLYFEVKGMKENDDLANQETKYVTIETEFNKSSEPKQVIFANWYAHYKLFGEKDFSWMDEQIHFEWWKDKFPQSAKVCLLALLLLIITYYCYAVPALNVFLRKIFFL